MNWYIFADCLWTWGGFILSLCIIHKITEYDVKIQLEEERMDKEESGW